MSDGYRICIIERDLFVSQDMVDSLLFVMPSVECSIFESATEARLSTQHNSDPQLVVISADADGNLRISPEDMIWLKQRGVITFDAHNQAAFPEWTHMNKPFAEDDLVQAVKRFLGVTDGRVATA